MELIKTVSWNAQDVFLSKKWNYGVWDPLENVISVYVVPILLGCEYDIPTKVYI